MTRKFIVLMLRICPKRLAIPYTVFGGGMLQVKQTVPKVGELSEGTLNFTLMNRLENQRTFDKENPISVDLKTQHLGRVLTFAPEDTLSLTVASDIPSAPVKLGFSTVEDGKIVLDVSQTKVKGEEETSVKVEISKSEFKVLQLLIQFSIPRLLMWDTQKPQNANAPFEARRFTPYSPSQFSSR